MLYVVIQESSMDVADPPATTDLFSAAVPALLDHGGGRTGAKIRKLSHCLALYMHVRNYVTVLESVTDFHFLTFSMLLIWQNCIQLLF